MTDLEVLKAARERVAKGWTQGADARDGMGRGTEVNSDSTTCWCAGGAIYGFCRDGQFHTIRKLFLGLVGASEDNSLADWNDAAGRTQDEVIAAFDRLIRLTEGALKAPTDAMSVHDPSTDDRIE